MTSLCRGMILDQIYGILIRYNHDNAWDRNLNFSDLHAQIHRPDGRARIGTLQSHSTQYLDGI